MKDLLVEIGCEEIPAFVQEGAASALLNFLSESLKAKGFRVGGGRYFATPTRLAALLKVKPISEVVESEKVGPPAKVAYDPEGRPTMALLKFAESVGAKVEDAYIVNKGKGKYVAIKVRRGGEHIKDALGEILEEYVRTVPLPRRMRWDSSGLTFIRPIRWIVALLGDEILPVKLGRLKAGRTTYTGRLPVKRKVDIPEASLYEEVLEREGVVPDFEKRLRHVREETERFLRIDPERYAEYDTDIDRLLYEITGLVEKGYAVYGKYDESFLHSLYPEVIMAAMTAHQRYVPHLEDNLKAGFVAFSNNPKGLDIHRKGYESVLRARLDDALFYKMEDLKRPLSYYVENLRNVTWIKGLGSLYDRMERVKGITHGMPKPPGIEDDILEFVSTHYLFDTATSMIRDGKEFTKLEGKIGYYYARDILSKEWGDPEKADRYALGIYEARLPKGKRFPKTLEGMAVAIADSLNTVDGLIKIGYRWTSSRDPLGIRANVRRFLALLFYGGAGYEFGRYPLSDFLKLTETYDNKREVWESLIRDSLHNALGWVQNTFRYPYYPEEPDNILLTYDGNNIFLSAIKSRAYEDVVRGENREKFNTIVKRLRRIVKSEAKRLLKEDNPEEALTYEERLIEVLSSIKEGPLSKIRAIDPLKEGPENIHKTYKEYLNALLSLYEALDEFFTHVPVMVEDGGVRVRRLNLLKEALSLVDEILPGS